jgi:hypothetical protein
MKHLKSILTVLSLISLVYSCKKNSPDAPSPIVGNWNFTSEADTVFFIPQKMDTIVASSSTIYGYINFQPDGTVYTLTSFNIGNVVFGPSIYFAVFPNFPLLTDTGKYTITNNIVTISPKYGTPYKDSIVFVDNNKLVISNLLPPSNIYKKTYYYSK